MYDLDVVLFKWVLTVSFFAFFLMLKSYSGLKLTVAEPSFNQRDGIEFSETESNRHQNEQEMANNNFESASLNFIKV